MVKYTQTIRRQIVDDLFEYVWPYYGVGAYPKYLQLKKLHPKRLLSLSRQDPLELKKENWIKNAGQKRLLNTLNRFQAEDSK